MIKSIIEFLSKAFGNLNFEKLLALLAGIASINSTIFPTSDINFLMIGAIYLKYFKIKSTKATKNSYSQWYYIFLVSSNDS